MSARPSKGGGTHHHQDRQHQDPQSEVRGGTFSRSSDVSNTTSTSEGNDRRAAKASSHGDVATSAFAAAGVHAARSKGGGGGTTPPPTTEAEYTKQLISQNTLDNIVASFPGGAGQSFYELVVKKNLQKEAVEEAAEKKQDSRTSHEAYDTRRSLVPADATSLSSVKEALSTMSTEIKDSAFRLVPLVISILNSQPNTLNHNSMATPDGGAAAESMSLPQLEDRLKLWSPSSAALGDTKLQLEPGTATGRNVFNESQVTSALYHKIIVVNFKNSFQTWLITLGLRYQELRRPVPFHAFRYSQKDNCTFPMNVRKAPHDFRLSLRPLDQALEADRQFLNASYPGFIVNVFAIHQFVSAKWHNEQKQFTKHQVDRSVRTMILEFLPFAGSVCDAHLNSLQRWLPSQSSAGSKTVFLPMSNADVTDSSIRRHLLDPFGEVARVARLNRSKAKCGRVLALFITHEAAEACVAQFTGPSTGSKGRGYYRQKYCVDDDTRPVELSSMPPRFSFSDAVLDEDDVVIVPCTFGRSGHILQNARSDGPEIEHPDETTVEPDDRGAGAAQGEAQPKLHPCLRVFGRCAHRGEDMCKFSFFPWETCLRHLKGRCGGSRAKRGEGCQEFHPGEEEKLKFYALAKSPVSPPEGSSRAQEEDAVPPPTPSSLSDTPRVNSFPPPQMQHVATLPPSIGAQPAIAPPQMQVTHHLASLAAPHPSSFRPGGLQLHQPPQQQQVATSGHQPLLPSTALFEAASATAGGVDNSATSAPGDATASQRGKRARSPTGLNVATVNSATATPEPKGSGRTQSMPWIPMPLPPSFSTASMRVSLNTTGPVTTTPAEISLQSPLNNMSPPPAAPEILRKEPLVHRTRQIQWVNGKVDFKASPRARRVNKELQEGRRLRGGYGAAAIELKFTRQVMMMQPTRSEAAKKVILELQEVKDEKRALLGEYGAAEVDLKNASRDMGGRPKCEADRELLYKLERLVQEMRPRRVEDADDMAWIFG